MNKYTKSPWKIGTAIDDQALGVFQADVNIGDRCNAVCLISPLGKVTEEDEANAILIAAAPEMLDILTTMVTFLKNNGFSDHHVYRGYVEKAQAIINKAVTPIVPPKILYKVWTNSSTVSETSYKESTSELVVQFKNGKNYCYQSVPKEVWEELLQAESIGSFLAKNIKGKYQFVLL